MHKFSCLKYNATEYGVVRWNAQSGIRLVADPKGNIRLYIFHLFILRSVREANLDSYRRHIGYIRLSQSQQTDFGVELFNKIGWYTPILVNTG
jgi:hypothetical protein